jgi:hypothetical protein
MEVLSRIVERFPLWNATVFLAFVGVCIWLLTQLDELTRRHVELGRHLWQAPSTFESEFKKYKGLGRLFLWFCIIFNFICATVIVCAYQVVR